MTHVIGVDLGGTKTSAAVVGSDGSVVLEDQIQTPHRAGGAAVLNATGELISRLREQATVLGISVAGIGIGSAGVIEPVQGTVLSATNAIAAWAGTEIQSIVSTRAGLPVAVINDVHAHAMGEAWLGEGAAASSFLLVAIGTGLGGSFVVGGRPVLGHHFVAGHVGHMASSLAVDRHGTPLPCSCGGFGHLEGIASGSAVHDTYLRLGGDMHAEDSRAVFRRAHEGDSMALSAVVTGARAAGQALGGLANVLDPECIIISGGMAETGPLWWNPMVSAAQAELMPPLVGLPILPAALGNQAAIMGAAVLILDRIGSSRRRSKGGPCP